MSWFDRARGAALAVLTASVLGGCAVQPLYGPLSAGGGDVAAELRAIAVQPISGLTGHYLADDLIFDLNGTGSHETAKYKLFVTLHENSQTAIIDTVTGLASAATVNLGADYRLEPVGGGKPVTSGTAIVIASYDRNEDRYSNIRAARAAEIRDAKQLSDQIRLRLATALSPKGS